MSRIAIIGAGAAGCFCAQELLRRDPSCDLRLYEAGKRPLAKVLRTGGGRCNLTNGFEGLRGLAEAYPRGHRLMEHLLHAFSPADTRAWFLERGVPTVLQRDGCVFPASQDARDVAQVLGQGLPVSCGKKLVRLSPGWTLTFQDGTTAQADVVIVTAGGQPGGIPFLAGLDLPEESPVPSLFTFNVPDQELKELMGLVVPAQVFLPGTPFRAQGPLLITDWGLSGPAVLKLSSYAARHLHAHGYAVPLGVCWAAQPEAAVREVLQQQVSAFPRKHLRSLPPSGLPGRLWAFLLRRAALREDLCWGELGRKGLNRLTALLTADVYPMTGKCKFREEFVTAGGVSLRAVHPRTLESKRYPGLYFAGEVLDIDAITGGFNLQAAWSTAHAVAQALRPE